LLFFPCCCIVLLTLPLLFFLWCPCCFSNIVTLLFSHYIVILLTLSLLSCWCYQSSSTCLPNSWCCYSHVNIDWCCFLGWYGISLPLLAMCRLEF
jgi:hypothetical protein